MKKLLLVSHGLSTNGIETLLVNILKNLNLSRYEVTMAIAIDEGVFSVHEKEVTDLGVKVIHAGDMDTLKKKLTFLKNVNNIMKNGSFDIVHTNMDLLNGVILRYAEKAGIRCRICHAHNTKSQYKPGGKFKTLKKAVQKLYYRLMKALMNSCSTDFIACSKEASAYFFGSSEKAEIVYNGMDIEKFVPADTIDRREYLSMPAFSKEKVIVSVGRLSDQKNYQFSLKVIAELKKIRQDFTYIWVGQGSGKKEFEDIVSGLRLEDTVYMLGQRTDVGNILACSDVFFLPSLFEGLGIVFVEAQLAGLPCVASTEVPELADIGGMKYYPLKETARFWAERLNEALDNPVFELDEEKAKCFDIKNTVKQIEAIYG